MGRKNGNAGDRWEPDHAGLSALRSAMAQFAPGQLADMAGGADPAAGEETGETVDQAAARHDDEMFGPADADPEWATPGFDPARK